MNVVLIPGLHPGLSYAGLSGLGRAEAGLPAKSIRGNW